MSKRYTPSFKSSIPYIRVSKSTASKPFSDPDSKSTSASAFNIVFSIFPPFELYNFQNDYRLIYEGPETDFSNIDEAPLILF